MADIERDAYSVGFEAAVSHVRRTIRAWAEDRGVHSACSCPTCLFLRQLAGSFCQWKSLIRGRQLTTGAVQGYATGYQAGLTLLQSPIRQWVDVHGPDGRCECDICRELRLLAGKRYGPPIIL